MLTDSIGVRYVSLTWLCIDQFQVEGECERDVVTYPARGCFPIFVKISGKLWE